MVIIAHSTDFAMLGPIHRFHAENVHLTFFAKAKFLFYVACNCLQLSIIIKINFGSFSSHNVFILIQKLTKGKEKKLNLHLILRHIDAWEMCKGQKDGGKAHDGG